MTLEHYIIIASLIIILFLFITNRSIKKNLTSEVSKFNNYKKEMSANLQKDIPHGERLLFNAFHRLFEDQSFKDFTIYHHLEFKNGDAFNQIDFFVVSPKGLFVIESKRWSGITYIYSKSNINMFSNTVYEDFGVGSADNIRIFNAKRNKEGQDLIKFSLYGTHPVVQARGYSANMRNILGVSNSIKNVVIFGSCDESNTLYNGAPLIRYVSIGLTTLMTDKGNNIKHFFMNLPDEIIDIDLVNKMINDGTFSFVNHLKMDINNYQQAPFSQFG